MKVKDLFNKVQKAVQDESFDFDFVLSAFNQCLGELASVYTLPDLLTLDLIECPVGEFWTEMPDQYLKGLDFAYNITKKNPVKVVKALTTFLSKFPDLNLNPPVTHVCVQGRTLYFQGIPKSTETLRVFFIRNPEKLTGEYSEPEAVPEHLHEGLFVNFGCAACFNLIEEGMDGAKINFNKYMGLYQKDQVKLEQFLGVPPESPDYVPDLESNDEIDV